MSRIANSVFMIVSGNWKGGALEIPPFIDNQAHFVTKTGWRVVLGVVDDRTSVSGILRNVRRIKEEIATAAPCIIHAQYGSVTAAVARMVRGQLPLVVSFCGDDLLGTPLPGLTWRVRDRCARSIGLWAAGKAAAVIVKSNNLRSALPSKLQRLATVLPNGVDTDSFKPLDQASCRSTLGWPQDAKIVLFNASRDGNEAVKNYPLAQAAMDRVARSLPEVYLHQMSQASREQVNLMMNAADCLLVTSLHEGSPNIVKEAMSCNLPVVSVPCGDVVERVSRTHPGSVCPYDETALANAVTTVLRRGWRSNGRSELMSQGLTALGVASRVVKIYEELSAGTRGATRSPQAKTCVG